MLRKLFEFLGIAFLLGGSPVHASSIMNEQDFTQRYVSYLSATRPQIMLEVIHPLEIKAKTQEHDFGTLFLRNMYDLYRQDPDRRDELFSKYTLSILDHTQTPPVSLETLVAVVKAKEWVEDMNRIAMGPEGQGFYILSEPINPDLFIVYATDTPHSVTYQDREKILALDPSIEKIKEESLRNLRTAIGSYTFEPVDHGVYELRSGGGDYDSCLPLLPDAFDKFPDRHNGGDIVFSIPSRNILIATSSINKQGIAFIHELNQKIRANDPYFISDSLFTIKNASWVIYKE